MLNEILKEIEKEFNSMLSLVEVQTGESERENFREKIKESITKVVEATRLDKIKCQHQNKFNNPDQCYNQAVNIQSQKIAKILDISNTVGVIKKECDREFCKRAIFRGKHTCKGIINFKGRDFEKMTIPCPCICHEDLNK